MSIGRELLNVPMGDMIRQMAFAIAEAQVKLDESSIEVAEMMGGLRTVYDDEGNIAFDDSRIFFGHEYMTPSEADSLVALDPGDDPGEPAAAVDQMPGLSLGLEAGEALEVRQPGQRPVQTGGADLQREGVLDRVFDIQQRGQRARDFLAVLDRHRVAVGRLRHQLQPRLLRADQQQAHKIEAHRRQHGVNVVFDSGQRANRALEAFHHSTAIRRGVAENKKSGLAARLFPRASREALEHHGPMRI